MSKDARVNGACWPLAAAVTVTLSRLRWGTHRCQRFVGGRRRHPRVRPVVGARAPDRASLRHMMDQFEAENPGIKVKLLSAGRTPRPRSRSSPAPRPAPCPTSSASTAPGSATSPSRARSPTSRTLMTDAELRRQPAGQPGQGRRQDLHDPGGQLRLPAVRQRRPAEPRPASRRRPPTAPSSWTRPRRSARSAATSRAGRCRSSLEAPNGIQNDVMSWVWASGGIMLKDGKPDLTNDDVKSTRRLRQEPVRRRRHRPRSLHHEGAGQGRGVHQRPGRHDDRLARSHQPDPEEQPEPEVQHLGHPGRGRLHRQARHPVRVVGHRHRRQLRAQGRGVQARSSS